MLEFPQAIRAFLIGIGLIWAVAIFCPETLSAVKIATFFIASIIAGSGVGFSAQAKGFTWATWAIRWDFVMMFLQLSIGMVFAYFWLMTLTVSWLFDLL